MATRKTKRRGAKTHKVLSYKRKDGVKVKGYTRYKSRH